MGLMTSAERLEELDRQNREKVIASVPVNTELEKARKQLAKFEAEAAAVEAEHLGKIRQREQLIESVAKIEKELQNGEYYRGLAEEDANQTTLEEWSFPGKHPNQAYNSYQGARIVATNILAARLLLERYPAWHEKKQTELKATNDAIEKLNRELKISGK